MIITRATEYAIRALIHLAKQTPGEIVLKSEICKAQDITPAFLTKILQPLIKAGIVSSQRGVGGGFFLVKDPAEVTLLDILEAQEGPLSLNHCLLRPETCDRQNQCPVHGAWHKAQKALRDVLVDFDLARLVQEEGRLQETLPHLSTTSPAP